VDTFEEEEDIDLAAVAAKLRQCDREMVGIDQTIKAFCDDLGIDAPF
jgi:type I restriction enzyme M protein